MNPTELARRAATGLLDFTGISQRRASEIIGMDQKRISERIRMGSLFLRDFLEIAHAEDGANFLRMLADQMDAEDSHDRPIDAAMSSTEAAASAQGVVRGARQDGHFDHYEVLQIRESARKAHAEITKFLTVAENLEPGPVSQAFAAE